MDWFAIQLATKLVTGVSSLDMLPGIAFVVLVDFKGSVISAGLTSNQTLDGYPSSPLSKWLVKLKIKLPDEGHGKSTFVMLCPLSLSQ